MSAEARLLATIASLSASTSGVDIARALADACLAHTASTAVAAGVQISGSRPESVVEGMDRESGDELFRHVANFGTPGRPVVAGPGSTLIRSLPQRFGVGSLVRVAHEAGDARIDILLVGGENEPIGHEDADLVVPLASIATVAASNLAYQGKSRRYVQWMGAIEDTAVVLLRGVAPRAVLDGVLDEVARHALQRSGATLAGVATPDNEGTSMYFRCAIGRQGELLEGKAFPEDHSLCGEVMRRLRTVSVLDASHDPRSYWPISSPLGLGPTAIGPLRLHDRVVGVVFVGNLHGDGLLDPTRALEAVEVVDLDGLVRATTGASSVSDELQVRLRKLKATSEGWGRFSALDTRELEMLELVAEGLTNAEIGAQLGLAEKTVRNAVSVMLGKLGVANRVEAAVMIARHAERFGRLRA